METLDRTVIKSIAADAKKALEAVASKYGVDFSLGGGSFTSATFTPKLEFKVKSDGKAMVERNELLATQMGLPKDVVGKSIVTSKGTYIITGLNPKRPKYAVEVDKNGEARLLALDFVVRYFEKMKIQLGGGKDLQQKAKTTITLNKPKGGLRLMPNPLERKEAEKNGINFNTDMAFVIMTPDKKFINHQTKSPISSYNNGMLKMLMNNALKVYPANSVVVNENISTNLILG